MDRADSAYEREVRRLEQCARYRSRPHHRGREKLAGMVRLLEALGNPQSGARVVHIAGTNGKGLTAEMVNRLLLAEGGSVGLYTSPHLVDVRERVRINGALIDRAAFALHCRAVLDTAERERLGDTVTYFDLVTAIAFLAFRDAGVAWWVLETGLGGLADSTNVTAKELAILTRIGIDHAAVLGSGLAEIALQKMGIVRPGTPTVLARQSEEWGDWMEARLRAKGSAVVRAELGAPRRDPAMPDRVEVFGAGGLRVALRLPPHRATLPFLDCAASALAAGSLLLGEPSSRQLLARRAAAVLGASLRGRLQWLRNVPVAGHPERILDTLILDGAHNGDALGALVTQLGEWGTRDYTLILGMMRDKLVPEIAAPLRSLLAGARRFIALDLPFERAAPGVTLAGFCRDLLAVEAPELPMAWARPAEALALAPAGRPVVIAGSLWALGELLPLLTIPESPPVVIVPAEEGPPAEECGEPFFPKRREAS